MSGKSKEEIAFELVSKLKGVGVWGENNMSSILDMYAECLEATSGNRQVKGLKPQTAIPAPQQFVPQQPAATHAAPRQATPHAPQAMPQAAPQPMAQAYNPTAQQR